MDKKKSRKLTKGKFVVGVKALLPLTKVESKLEEDLMRTVEEIREYQHPCIIKVLEMTETSEKVITGMEFAAGGELFGQDVRGDLGTSSTPLPESVVPETWLEPVSATTELIMQVLYITGRAGTLYNMKSLI